MEPLLRDPVWQFVGVVVALIAIIVAVVVPLILFRKQRKKKALEYRVLTSTPVFRNPIGSGKFELLFEKQPVEGVQLIIIRIANAGDVEITPNDYHEHIAVELSPDSPILSAEIIQTSPAELKTVASISANRVVFPPVLLNAGDWFTVQCLVASFKDGIKVSGRISGVKQISEHVRRTTTTRLLWFASGFFWMLIILSGYMSDRTGRGWPFWTGIICGVLWLLAISAHHTFRVTREQKLFG